MNKKGFTLIELLAVIVILAIIALIATPIVLDIISDTKKSAQLRGAEFYLDAVEQAVANKMMNDSTFKAKECKIQADGDLNCDGTDVKVEVSGSKPTGGIIILENSQIKNIELELSEETIVKNNKGELIYTDKLIESAKLYLEKSEQAITTEMKNDSTFKAKECKIQADGNLLCSELGFNVCEMRTIDGEYVLVCSGIEKEVVVEVSEEKPTEGIIELNNGKVENTKMIMGCTSLTIKDNNLVLEKDTKLIYESDSINLNVDAPPFNIAHLVDYNTIYKVSLDYPAKNFSIEQRGMLIDEDGVTYLLVEGGGGLLVSDKEPDTSNSVAATLKISKTNQKIEKYGVRISQKRFLIISNEFVPGEAIISIKDENDKFLYSNIVEFRKSVGKYVEYDKGIDATAYNNLKDNKKVTVIITQNINDNLVIRQYGGTTPKYQKEHDYSYARDSFYWGTDFFPFAGE